MHTYSGDALDQVLEARLQSYQDKGLYRTRRRVHSPTGAEIRFAQKTCLNFSSNDYLGLANHPKVVDALCDAAKRGGVGSGASHLISGHHEAHHELECALAELTGRSRALVFSSGFQANMGIITALMGRHDTLFEDRLNHASLIDAGRASGATCYRYEHLNGQMLKDLLSKHQKNHAMIVTDAIFSMDGDVAPLMTLSDIAEQQQAWLMIDDAHGLGVMGHRGDGSAAHYGLTQAQVPIMMATLGKAVGTFGAFVAGSEALIESLIQFARPYIYTTALPPALAKATLVSLACMQQESWRREHLKALIRYFKQCAADVDLPLMPSITAIQPVLVGDSEKCLNAAQALLDKGIYVPAIRPPTVPKHGARLRVTLTASHTRESINRLIDAIVQLDLVTKRTPYLPHAKPVVEGFEAKRHDAQVVVKPTWVLVAGWGFKPTVFDSLKLKLQDLGQVISLSLPYDINGLSSPDDALTEWAHSLLGQVPQGAHLVGWSLGGLVAMKMALLAPQRVSSLITLGTNPCFVQSNDWRWGISVKRFESFMHDFGIDPQQALQRFCLWVSQGSPSLKRESVYLRQNTVNPKTYFSGLSLGLSLLRSCDLKSQIDHIECPWLQILGTQDSLVPAELVHAARNELEHQAKKLEAGHAFFVAYPDAVAQLMMDFVCDLSDNAFHFAVNEQAESVL